ncbi:MAG: hypothetical protein IJS32_07180 [Kiritimatiellae bacterium]|nr:hypothetical protein [Kiritimatiellia bacterium]
MAVANAYFRRWSVEVLYQDLKQAFGLEKARVRTFKRLRNLVAPVVLTHEGLAHFLFLYFLFSPKILPIQSEKLPVGNLPCVLCGLANLFNVPILRGLGARPFPAGVETFSLFPAGPL